MAHGCRLGYSGSVACVYSGHDDGSLFGCRGNDHALEDCFFFFFLLLFLLLLSDKICFADVITVIATLCLGIHLDDVDNAVNKEKYRAQLYQIHVFLYSRIYNHLCHWIHFFLVE